MDFESEMKDFVRFLDSIDASQEAVVAIIPNSGLSGQRHLFTVGLLDEGLR